jgi:hypothetical protein
MVGLPATLLTAIVLSNGPEVPRVTCATGGWRGGAVFEIDTIEGRETVLMGTPELEEPDTGFSGALGFISGRDGAEEASGLGIGKWIMSGSDVAYKRVASLLSGP